MATYHYLETADAKLLQEDGVGQLWPHAPANAYRLLAAGLMIMSLS